MRYDKEYFTEDLIWFYARAGNILQQYGFTLEKLRQLPLGGDGEYVITTVTPKEKRIDAGVYEMRWYAWYELFDIYGFGWKSMTKLVEFCRSREIELPWFGEWDKKQVGHK